MLDIGCPSVVISDELVTRLGLRRFRLPAAEDNLSSLSDTPLDCREWVRLEVVPGKGAWISGTMRALVNVGLPVPLLLGMSFLSAEHIIIHSRNRTATDERTGYDLAHPPRRPKNRAQPPPPPPAPPSPQVEERRTLPVQLEDIPPPKLDGSLLHPSIMAMVQERMESLAFQELLREKDKKFKEEFSDRFPLRLPDTTKDLPTDIYHRVRLRDPNLVVKGRGYSAPKEYHDAWNKLLDEHFAAGRIRPSSEHASPAFCIPKYKDGKPDLSRPPRWVNDYRELNSNTIRDNFPLPRVDETLADCGKGRIFGKMDMTNSFFQTRMHPDDIHLTAVRTPWGLYEWVVMPMEGCNAPSTHQRRMTAALRHLIGKMCHVYLDDIIIWSMNTNVMSAW